MQGIADPDGGRVDAWRDKGRSPAPVLGDRTGGDGSQGHTDIAPHAIDRERAPHPSRFLRDQGDADGMIDGGEESDHR